MKVLGIESSCDETGVAVYDTALSGRGRPARPRGVQPDRPARRIRRGGAGTGQPRPCAQAAAAGPADPGRGRVVGLRPRWRGLHRRSGPGRGAAGGRRGGALAGLGAGGAGDRRPPHGRPPAGAADGGRPACRAVRGPAGVRRAYPTGGGGRHRQLPAAGRDPGRCRRRGLRQDRQADGPALSRRTAAGQAGRRAARPACTSSPGR